MGLVVVVGDWIGCKLWYEIMGDYWCELVGMDLGEVV